MTQSSSSPLKSKSFAILALRAPNTLKNLCSFIDPLIYLSKITPNLAQLCHPLKPLIRKLIRNEEHITRFNAIKTRIENHTDNNDYNPKLETCVKCDSSRSGPGAALEQLTVDEWKSISFVSGFSNSNEERYSNNEFEILGVFWFIEYCKNDFYVKEFSVITRHRILLSILKQHRSNNSHNSRLSRWFDRLLQFQAKIEHLHLIESFAG